MKLTFQSRLSMIFSRINEKKEEIESLIVLVYVNFFFFVVRHIDEEKNLFRCAVIWKERIYTRDLCIVVLFVSGKIHLWNNLTKTNRIRSIEF